MNIQTYTKPPLDTRFLATNVISWKIRKKPTFDHGKYVIRFEITLNNGETIPKQIGGFKTEADAYAAKENLILTLGNHQFIPYQFTVQEFYDYWLYYYMLDEAMISYNTFISYRKSIERFIEYVGAKKKINSLTSNNI